MTLPEIGSLWIGENLSWLEQLCLQSFLDQGHQVTLFAYRDVLGVPDGVKVEDANTIFPSDNIVRHAKTGSPAFHSDVFRLHMLQQTDYIWADTDAYCCKPWDIGDTHFFGWNLDNSVKINSGVLRLPKSSKALDEMLQFTKDEFPIPPWTSETRQQFLRDRKSEGSGVHVSLLAWGVWGPDALTWFLKKTGEDRYARPAHVLYPVPFEFAGAPLKPNRVKRTKRFIREDTLSIHFWGRRFRNIAKKFNGLPPEGSYVYDLLVKHNIDPAEAPCNV